MPLKKKWPFNICEDGYTKIAKLLLKMGAYVNIKIMLMTLLCTLQQDMKWNTLSSYSYITTPTFM